MNNQLKWGIILSYVSTGLNIVIQLVYTPIMIRLLGQSEYGLYTLVGSIVSNLSLFSLGFTGAYLRFYSRYKKDNQEKEIARLNGMFLTIFLCMSATALLCGITLSEFPRQLFGTHVTAQEMEKAKLLMQILVVNIALTFPSSVFDSIISAHEQFILHRSITLAGVIFNPLICLPLLLMGYGSVAVVCITTVITVCKMLVGIWYCLKKLDIRFVFSDFDTSLLREMSHFSFFIFLNMIIDQVNWSVDKYILGRISGTAAVAVYGVGAQINALYVSFSTAVSSVFSPRVNRIVSAGEKDMKKQMTELFIKVGRIQFIILAFVFIAFFAFGRYFIMEIYAGNEYAESYWVALALILPVTIPLIQNLGIEIQRAMNKHQFRSIVYFIMAVINIFISIELAYIWGPFGCAFGTGVSLLIANGIIMNIYYQKVLGIDVISFWKSILGLMRGAILPVVLGVMFYKMNFDSFGKYSLSLVAFLAGYIVSMWFFGMNQEEKGFVFSVTDKFRT